MKTNTEELREEAKERLKYWKNDKPIKRKVFNFNEFRIGQWKYYLRALKEQKEALLKDFKPKIDEVVADLILNLDLSNKECDYLGNKIEEIKQLLEGGK